MVFTIATAKRKSIAKFPSFHPKFWLIRYIDEYGEPIYRIVVLSRNLTFDRSWDITFCMEGKKVSEGTTKNNPVSDFLAYLVKQLPSNDNAKDKQKKIRAISRELKNIKFELNSKEFTDFEFIPVGVRNTENNKFYSMYDYPLFYDSFHEVLITLGQARQEELLEYIFENCEKADDMKELFINLSPYYKKVIKNIYG